MKSSFFLLGVLACAPLATLPAQAQTRTLSTGLTNIAAAQNGGRVLSVTSTLDNKTEFSANNLIDGKAYNFKNDTGSKGWASDQYDPINMDSVTLGFAGNINRKIGKIVLNPSVDLTPERWAKDVEVQVSTTSAEGPFTAVSQLTLKREAVPQEFMILPVDAKFVRLVFRTNWGSDRTVSLGEVEIYEAIDGSDPMGAVINRLEAAVKDLRSYRDFQADMGGARPVGAAPQAAAQPAARRAPSNGGAKVQKTQLVANDPKSFPTGERNIAAAANGGKILDSSSTYNKDEAYSAKNLIDGQNYSPADDKGSNGWASEGFEPGKQWVTIGFADDRVKLIGRVTINPVSSQSDLRWARRIEVQVTSGDYIKGPWKPAATISVSPRPINQDFTIRPVEAKFVRFVFLANGPGGIELPNADPNVNSDRAVSLGEIEIYEAVAGDDRLESVIGRFEQVLTDFKTLREQQIKAGIIMDDLPAAPAPVAAKKPTNAAKPIPAPTLSKPAPGKVTTSIVKTTPKPAKKNLEEARLDHKSNTKDG